jgi:hypothetical protein
MSKKHSEKFEWMSTREICDHLGISSRTLERYRKRPAGSNPFPILIARIWADPTGT